MPTPVPSRAWLSTAVAACVLLTSCQSAPEPAPSRFPSGAADPAVTQGLRFIAWEIEDPDGFDAARALDAYVARPVPGLDDSPAGVALRERLTQSGLRFVAVPRADLEAIRERLNIAGPVGDRWMLDASRWSVLHAAPSRSQPDLARLYDGDLLLEPGRLRVLGRAWPVPQATADGFRPVMNLEIVAQHVPRARPLSAFEAALEPQRLKDETEIGVLFRTLQFAAVVPDGEAIVIASDPPGRSWADPPPPPPRQVTIPPPPDDNADEREPGPKPESPAEHTGPDAPPSVSPAGSEAGPPVPVVRTLGECLLTVPRGPKGVRRTILVIAPYLPPRYESAR